MNSYLHINLETIEDNFSTISFTTRTVRIYNILETLKTTMFIKITPKNNW